MRTPDETIGNLLSKKRIWRTSVVDDYEPREGWSATIHVSVIANRKKIVSVKVRFENNDPGQRGDGAWVELVVPKLTI